MPSIEKLQSSRATSLPFNSQGRKAPGLQRHHDEKDKAWVLGRDLRQQHHQEPHPDLAPPPSLCHLDDQDESGQENWGAPCLFREEKRGGRSKEIQSYSSPWIRQGGANIGSKHILTPTKKGRKKKNSGSRSDHQVIHAWKKITLKNLQLLGTRPLSHPAPTTMATGGEGERGWRWEQRKGSRKRSSTRVFSTGM
jgi:hypothetical protein